MATNNINLGNIPNDGKGDNLRAGGQIINNHINNTSNPHSVTKTQVGLGNADNTSDLNKPISTATQSALNAKQSTSEKAQANGYASLDGTGKVPLTQIPSTTGTGDMLKNTYDTNDDGIVNQADTITSQGALATLDTVDTEQIDNNAVTFAKMQDIPQNQFIGRNTAGSGEPEMLSATQARDILDVYTTSETDTLLLGKQDILAEGAFVDGDKTKLDNSAEDSEVVHLTGDETIPGNKTFTNILEVENDIISSGTSPGFFVNYTGTYTGGKSLFALKQDNSLRWAWGHGGTESGSNAGSNFQLFRYSDAGNVLGTALHINRDSGKVGIGTTSPYDKGHIRTTGTGVTNGLRLQNSNGSTIGAGVGLVYTTFSSDIPTGRIDNIRSSTGIYNLVFSDYRSIGLVEAMRISNGKLGLGKTNPASPIHIYQNNTGTGAGAGLTIEQDGTGDAVVQILRTGIVRWKVGSPSDGSFAISNGALTSPELKIRTDGRTEIGRTTLNNGLIILGDANTANAHSILDSSANKTMIVTHIGNNVRFYWKDFGGTKYTASLAGSIMT